MRNPELNLLAEVLVLEDSIKMWSKCGSLGPCSLPHEGVCFSLFVVQENFFSTNSDLLCKAVGLIFIFPLISAILALPAVRQAH